jgi:hypothetical protein
MWPDTCQDFALRPAELRFVLSTAEWPGWFDRLSAEQASIRAALSRALGGREPEAGRELTARLARWWIATGRYSEAGQFLTMAAGVPAATAPGVQARVMLGAAWSAYHLGDIRGQPRSPPTASLVPGNPRNRGWNPGAATCWPSLAWHAGDADRIIAGIEASRALSGQADPPLAARANAALLSGDLADQGGRAAAAGGRAQRAGPWPGFRQWRWRAAADHVLADGAPARWAGPRL